MPEQRPKINPNPTQREHVMYGAQVLKHVVRGVDEEAGHHRIPGPFVLRLAKSFNEISQFEAHRPRTGSVEVTASGAVWNNAGAEVVFHFEAVSRGGYPWEKLEAFGLVDDVDDEVSGEGHVLGELDSEDLLGGMWIFREKREREREWVWVLEEEGPVFFEEKKRSRGDEKKRGSSASPRPHAYLVTLGSELHREPREARPRDQDLVVAFPLLPLLGGQGCEVVSEGLEENPVLGLSLGGPRSSTQKSQLKKHRPNQPLSLTRYY